MTEEIGSRDINNNCRIKVSANGPYIVSGEVPLTIESISVDAEGNPDKWETCKEYPPQPQCTLCRCGQSKNKPYCDGAHLKAKFNGTETASRESYRDQAEKTDGPTLELTDVPKLCAVARFCHRAGGTWNLTEQSDNPEARKIAIEEAGNCPSGRLVEHNKATGEEIEPEFQKSICLVEDPQKGVSGPIWVRGNVPVQSADGQMYETRNRVTLCRCGKSRNKPFCDGNHISIGFRDGHEMILEEVMKKRGELP
jgi:CDGSH-type Zn-finger protein